MQSRKKQGSREMAEELLLIKAFSLSLSFVDELIYSILIPCLHINHIHPQLTHPSLSVHKVYTETE